MSIPACRNVAQTGRRALCRSATRTTTIQEQSCSCRSFASSSRRGSSSSIPRSVSSPSTNSLTNPQRPTVDTKRTYDPTLPFKSSKRSFFSLPDISKLAKITSNATSAVPGQGANEGQVEMDGDKQIYHARKILPYSQKQLYQLVSDIPSYSSFIPFCTSSNVLSPSPPTSSSSRSPLPTAGNGARRQVAPDWTPPVDEAFEVDAELRVGFGGFEEAYVSRVVGTPWESVRAEAGEAPLFKSLSTTWSFSPASTFSPHPSSTIPSSSTDEPSSSSTQKSRTAGTSAEADPSSGPTLLTIDLAFEFTNPLHRIASQAVLPKVANRMVEAFEKRCLEVWGKGRD